MSFVKIYGQELLASSLWEEDPRARFVFLGMLALAESDGFVNARSHRTLKRMLNVPMEWITETVPGLEAEDPDSRCKEFGGSRIVRDNDRMGWWIPSYEQYRDRGRTEEARAAEAERKRASRAALKAEREACRPDASDSVRTCPDVSGQMRTRPGASAPIININTNSNAEGGDHAPARDMGETSQASEPVVVVHKLARDVQHYPETTSEERTRAAWCWDAMCEARDKARAGRPPGIAPPASHQAALAAAWACIAAELKSDDQETVRRGVWASHAAYLRSPGESAKSHPWQFWVKDPLRWIMAEGRSRRRPGQRIPPAYATGGAQ